MSIYGSYEEQPIIAELYDLVPAYTNRPDVEFYIHYCRLAKQRVLELGCGTGRILLPAAETGVDITGLDLSEYMLARCRWKLSMKPGSVKDRVQLFQGNIIDFNLEDRFDLAILPFRVFQHLIAIEDQMACLKNIHRHLSTGGRLVFDVFQVNFSFITDPRRKEECKLDEEVELTDGRIMWRTHCVPASHQAEQYNDIEIYYYVKETSGEIKRFEHTFPMRYFFRYEVEHLLARCGFRVVDLFGDFDRSALNDDSPEMIFVAEKD